MMRVITVFVVMLLMLFPATATMENIVWCAPNQMIKPASNALSYTVKHIWRDDGANGPTLHMEVVLMAREDDATLYLSDFAAMTRENDAFYPIQASTPDGNYTLEKESLLTIPMGNEITLDFVFPVSDGIDEFILVYLNAASDNFYAISAVFAPKVNAQDKETVTGGDESGQTVPTQDTSTDIETSSWSSPAIQPFTFATEVPAKECLICGGSGKVTCTLCHGQGSFEAGGTIKTCGSCLGIGERVCVACMGRGHY